MATEQMQNLGDCFMIKLKALYDIETQITKALPDLQKGATDKKLKKAFGDHLKETKNHVKRLEMIFKLLDSKKEAIEVEAIRGLKNDASWVLKQKGTPEAIDSTLIASAQYVEHYEMAGYKALIEWATVLKLPEIKKLLQKTLAEEMHADTLLTSISKVVNKKANSTR